MENTVKNAVNLYDFKNIIIDTIRKENEGITKTDGETKDNSAGLSWLKYPNNFKELKDEYNAEPDFGLEFPSDNRT